MSKVGLSKDANPGQSIKNLDGEIWIFARLAQGHAFNLIKYWVPIFIAHELEEIEATEGPNPLQTPSVTADDANELSRDPSTFFGTMASAHEF